MSGTARRGFTLIEILVVVAIAGILATMTVPVVLRAVKRGQIDNAAETLVQAFHRARQATLHRRIDDPTTTRYWISLDVCADAIHIRATVGGYGSPCDYKGAAPGDAIQSFPLPRGIQAFRADASGNAEEVVGRICFCLDENGRATGLCDGDPTYRTFSADHATTRIFVATPNQRLMSAVDLHFNGRTYVSQIR